VWWLRGLGSCEKLHGIFGGMECIVDTLTNKLRAEGLKLDGSLDHSSYMTKCQVTEVFIEGEKLQIKVKETEDQKEGSKRNQESSVAKQLYDHVVFAHPKCALEKIVYRNLNTFEREPQVTDMLNAAFGFPMIKLFIVVKDRWWRATMANRYATRVPTRELHFWPGSSKKDGERRSPQGLIMRYTDRPASSFWANYVKPGEQNDVDSSNSKNPKNRLREEVRTRLLRKIVQYINENDVPEFTIDDIAWYGIRDWGREPYGGANHAWRPERRYWIVMARLADICVGTPQDGVPCHLPRIHVCGEAYSDYHGFMEGSLRSGVYTLHRILDCHDTVDAELGDWLADCSPKNVNELKKWVKNVDSCRNQTDFLYK
jgi:hypothetical protein